MQQQRDNTAVTAAHLPPASSPSLCLSTTTVASSAGRGRGCVYRIDGSGDCVKLLSDMSIPNGLAWSKDGTRFFHTDTPTREVREFPYSVSSGKIGEGRVVVKVPEDFGYPDGFTIDDEDMLWIASWSE
jgi:sugar lactone lactonase YvrE